MEVYFNTPDFRKIEEISEQNLMLCYQCGRCSGGCPSVSAMDLLPNQAIRYLQMGNIRKVLDSKTIWICASCFMCTVRCPRGIDLARVFEAVRLLKLRENIDRVHLNKIEEGYRRVLPPIALISAQRKLAA